MTLTQIASAVALVGSIAGGVYVLEDRHAADEDVAELAGYVDRNFRDTSKIIQQLKRDTNRQFMVNEIRRLRWQLGDVERRTNCTGAAREYCDYLRGRIRHMESQR